MITKRIYLRSESLSKIHEELAAMETAGWQKASPLMYTHDEDGSGWEIALHRPVSEAEPPPVSFYDLFDGFVYTAVGLVVAVFVAAAALAVVKLIW